MAIGFKEWAVICDALEAGDLSVILRKGGIHEGRRGFEFEHDRFFLFPTSFHTQDGQVKRPAGMDAHAASEAADQSGTVRIRLAADLQWTRTLTDWAAVERTDGFHLWTGSVIEERFHWSDTPGIRIALLRVYQLPEPWVFPYQEGFGGCRSWIELPEPDPGLLDGMKPVLDDDRFGALREALESALPAE